MLTTLDDEAPVQSQQTGQKAKGKGKRAAPKVKAAPKSATANPQAPIINMDGPPSVTQSAPKKRGRPKGQGTSKGLSAPAVEPAEKKRKVTSQATPGNLPTQTKKIVAPRSPLPQRTNRNVHPGKPAMPRPKRTSAKVAEDKAEKAKLLQKLEELDWQKKIVLAEMELDEEEEDMEEEQTTVRHLKDLQDAETDKATPFAKDDQIDNTFPMDEDEPLWFPDSDEDDNEDSGSGSGSAQSKPQPSTKKKKDKRGETREAVEAEKTRLRQERKNLKPADIADKIEPQHKRLKETAKPSGLIKNWETRGISKGKGGAARQNSPTRATSPKDTLGGLTDEDLDSQRPSSKDLESKGRDAIRSNEIIHIAASDSEADLPKTVAVRLGKQRKQGIETEKSQQRETLKPEPSFDSSLNASSSIVSVKSESIEKPLFVMADWVTRFLPTLYHVLFCSEKPFHDFSKGSGFTDIVQKVLDTVHPRHTYVVTTSCKIYKTAYDRIVEKRSDFGIHALHLVEQHFKDAAFVNNSSAIAKYAKWATKDDGPALWRVPSAEGSSRHDDDYIKAQDLFESKFMVELLRWAIKKPLENSELVDGGHPKGAVALAAAAIERAFHMFHTGQKIRTGPFSRESHGGVVSDYMENLKLFSERRWTSLLTVCGVMKTPVQISNNTSSLSRTRHALYIPSSP